MASFCAQRSVEGREWMVRGADDFQSRDGYRLGDMGASHQKGDGIIGPLTLEIALRRGINDIGGYFDPKVNSSMPNPSILSCMDEATERFCQAIMSGENIVVYGDYDVDGATSTAIMVKYLRGVGLTSTDYYIPHRLEEGYGPNSKAMDELKSRGFSLVVIVDSGTSSLEPIEHARKIGLDVIVLDHHDIREDGVLPNAIVVNPKKHEDKMSPHESLEYLCSAGLSLLFLVSANRYLRKAGFFNEERREIDLRGYYGIVTLGTIADMVPLIGLNRAFVYRGISMVEQNIGIQAINKVVFEEMSEKERQKKLSREKYHPRSPQDVCTACGFTYGPRINAAGRIGNTMLGARLLLSENMEEAIEVARKLNELNRERQVMQEEMIKRGREICQQMDVQDPAIVIYDENFHPGVVGLVAGKLRDAYNKTTVVIGEKGKGSGRTVDGFDIGKALRDLKEAGLAVKAGGHKAAAGVEIYPEKIDEIRRFLNEAASHHVVPPMEVDKIVHVGDLSVEEVENFAFLYPFGMGNPNPVIAFTGGVLCDVQIVGGGTIKAKLVDGENNYNDVIWFYADGTRMGDAFKKAEGHYVDVVGGVSLNEYAGTTKIQIKNIIDFMVGPVAK